MGPNCPFCKTALISGALIGYKNMDVSFSHDDLRFLDVFYCTTCGGVLSIAQEPKGEHVA